MNLPKISIITANYNQGLFLEDTIKSVISQNYPNLEYIIIDGGSNDESINIIKKYQNYLAYWVSEKDNGHAEALNKGFSKSTGQIMAWINSDDKYYPWSFQVVAEIFQKYPDVHWIQGLPSIYDEKGRLVKIINKNKKDAIDFITKNNNFIQQESVFWRRSLWDKAGGKINEDYKLMVDHELWCRFFIHEKIWHLDRVIGGFRSHDSNRSKLFYNEVIKEAEVAIRHLQSELPEILVKQIGKVIRYRRLLYRYLKIFPKTNINFPIPLYLKRKLQKIQSVSNYSLAYNLISMENGEWVKKEVY